MIFNFGNANEKQIEAIKTTDGPLLIIAGPGTGKTFTLVKRIAYLIVEKKVSPKEVMAVTFTEKAAKELISRITDELMNYNIEIDVNEMYVGTFHQICLKILKEFREYTILDKNYAMMDSFDTQYFIYRNRKEFDDSIDALYKTKDDKPLKNWDKAAKIGYICSKIIEEVDEPEKLLMDTDEDIKTIGYIVERYRELLKNDNVLDFSSILSYCYNLLKDNEEIRNKMKERIKYIIVDEYQDTNKIQERILFTLLNEQKNICVVGDDDQGLYRFRGATITNLLTFTTKFKEGECKEILLNENYRSNQKIVDFYNDFMSNPIDFTWGKSRFEDKTIIASKSDNDKRDTVVRCTGNAGDNSWMENIHSAITNLKKQNIVTDYNQIAFLAYSISGDKIKEVINYLENHDVPCYAPRSKQFFYREEIKLLIGCLILSFQNVMTRLDDEKQHMNPNFRKYYYECVETLTKVMQSDKKRFAPLINYIMSLNNTYRNLSDKTNESFTDIIYEFLQFEPFSIFIEMKNIKYLQDERPIRNISLLTQLTTRFERLYKLNNFNSKNIDRHLNNFFFTYLWFLFDEGLGEYEDDKIVSPSGCVTFLTIHQSKGLEFPVVFIDSLGNNPQKSGDEKVKKALNKYKDGISIEEEDYIKYYDFWRLFYTGFSRAESLLVLTCKESSRTPSKYFREKYYALPEINTVNLKGLKLNQIKVSNVKDTYSFTSCVEIYNNCAKQYQFFHEYDFSEAKKGSRLYGSVVHGTIEDIHKAYMSNKGDEVNQTMIEEWFNVNYKTLSKNLFAYLRDDQKNAAFKEVMNYFKSQKGTFERLKEAEVDVSLIRDKYIMKGTIDLVTGDNDTVEIIDFKSIKKPDINKDKELLATYRKQLEVYAYLMEKYHGVKVSKMHLYFTAQDGGKPTITFEKDDKSIENTIKEFDDTIEKIQNKDFNKRTNKLKTCSNCNMNAYCNKRDVSNKDLGKAINVETDNTIKCDEE